MIAAQLPAYADTPPPCFERALRRSHRKGRIVEKILGFTIGLDARRIQKTGLLWIVSSQIAQQGAAVVAQSSVVIKQSLGVKPDIHIYSLSSINKRGCRSNLVRTFPTRLARHPQHELMRKDEVKVVLYRETFATTTRTRSIRVIKDKPFAV